MCIFSRPVDRVSNTSIFARVDGDTQFLVYEMHFSTGEDTAMTLPIPVRHGSGEDAVRFIALDGYPDFFKDMRAGFPEPVSRGMRGMRNGPDAAPVLQVHTVGSFEASYVPSVHDFSRLDKRFRLPDEVWAKLPRYADHGFVVFKLRAGQDVKAHPMAFSFPTQKPQKVFFPTVHIHDGKVHGEAEFDHSLYYQRAPGSPEDSAGDPDERRSEPASHFMKVDKAQGILRGELPCHRVRLQGMRPNLDILVRA